MTRFLAILKKELIQMRRDRLTLLIMLLMPCVQLLIYGYAINQDVKHLSAVVFDQSLSQESREFLDSLTATEYYNINYIANSYQEVNDLIQKGKAKVGVIIPPDYSKRIKHQQTAQIQVIVDATDSTSASSAISTAQLVGQKKSQEILIKKINSLGVSNTDSGIDVRIRPWYNPDFITAFFMVPGTTGIILTTTMTITTALAIVRERERGTLEQLIVTPLKSIELMIGKILPYVSLGYVQMTFLIVSGVLIFDVPVRGSLVLLYLLTGLFITASLGLGLMISNIATNQMQGMLMSVFILLPSMMLSGFVFPRESMPDFFFYLGYTVPVTFYLQIIRAILLKGAGISDLWPQVGALILYTVVVLSFSVKKFKKRLE